MVTNFRDTQLVSQCQKNRLEVTYLVDGLVLNFFQTNPWLGFRESSRNTRQLFQRRQARLWWQMQPYMDMRMVRIWGYHSSTLFSEWSCPSSSYTMASCTLSTSSGPVILHEWMLTFIPAGPATIAIYGQKCTRLVITNNQPRLSHKGDHLQ